LVTHFEAVKEDSASRGGIGNALEVGAGGSGSGGASTASLDLVDLVDFLQATLSLGSTSASLS